MHAVPAASLRLHLDAVLGSRIVPLQSAVGSNNYRKNAEKMKLKSVEPTHSSVDCMNKTASV